MRKLISFSLMMLAIVAISKAESDGDSSKGKYKVSNLRYIDKISPRFEIISVEHNLDYTVVTCGYDGKSKGFGSSDVVISKGVYLEDYSSKERYPVEFIKGVTPSIFPLEGRKRVELYFRRLKGLVRDANIYGSEGSDNLLISGLTIDRNASLRYRPEPITFGTVEYGDILGSYVEYPKAVQKVYQRRVVIKRVEYVNSLYIITFEANRNFNSNYSVYTDVMILGDLDGTWVGNKIEAISDMNSRSDLSSIRVNLKPAPYIKTSSKPSDKLYLTATEGIRGNKILFDQNGKAEFKFIFGSSDASMAESIDLFGPSHGSLNFYNIELSPEK